MQYRDNSQGTPSAARGRCGALLLHTRRHAGHLFGIIGLLVLVVTPSAEATQWQPIDDTTVSQPNYRHGERVRVPALVSSAANIPAAPGAAVRLTMTEQVADNLALLFEKFGESEFILCLEGEMSAEGEVRLSDFRMPHIAYSRSTSAGMHPDGTCSQYGNVVGTLHNHPRSHPHERERNNCYLSRTDIVSWLEYSEYPYTAVMCGPRVWAWWHREQVDLGKVLAFPPAEQISDSDHPNQSKD